MKQLWCNAPGDNNCGLYTIICAAVGIIGEGQMCGWL